MSAACACCGSVELRSQTDADGSWLSCEGCWVNGPIADTPELAAQAWDAYAARLTAEIEELAENLAR